MASSVPPNPQLTPREHVRKRPGMYIGGTDARALHHLVYEILDHMAEEAFVGRCRHIWIELQHNNEVVIRDDSGGLPVERYRDTTLTQMETLLQEIGTRKSEFEPQAYEVTGGLHGLGIAPVVMLTEYMHVQNRRDGFLWSKSYRLGEALTPLLKVELDAVKGETSGTTFRFKPDFTIFQAHDFDLKTIERRARELAYVLPGLTVTVDDLRTLPVYHAEYHYPEGLKTLISTAHGGAFALQAPVHIRENVTITGENGVDRIVGIEIAFQFSDTEIYDLHSYVNTVELRDGGTHLAALKAALLSCLNEYLDQYRRESDEPPFTWDEISRGLSAAISIRHPDPTFMSPTKNRLSSTDIYGPVAGLVFGAFGYDRHHEQVGEIVEHFLARRSP